MTELEAFLAFVFGGSALSLAFTLGADLLWSLIASSRADM